MYQSDITRFLQEMKARNPLMEEKQRRGRSLLWERPQRLEVAQLERESRLPTPSYSYYPKDYT
jgi:hypothetical protein